MARGPACLWRDNHACKALFIIPSRSAAAIERSINRPPTKGPRSVIGTVRLLRLLRLVTRTHDPRGSVRCAALNFVGSNARPLAIRWPASRGPYQDARPVIGGAANAEPQKSDIHPQSKTCLVVDFNNTKGNVLAFREWQRRPREHKKSI